MQTYQWLGLTSFVLPVGSQLMANELQLLDGPGNYIMAREERLPPGWHSQLYTGIARNLGERLLGEIHEKWTRATGVGVSHVHIFRVDEEQTSRDLETVLRYALTPPLQDQNRPLHETAYFAARRIGMQQVANQALANHVGSLRKIGSRKRLAHIPPSRAGNALAIALSPISKSRF